MEAPVLWPADVKTWSFSLEKTLMLGKIEGRRRREQQSLRWLDGITNSMDLSLSKLRETVEDRGAWRAAFQGLQRVGHSLATEQKTNKYTHKGTVKTK